MSSKFETILILDFGGQYTQLIGRRIREANVYTEIVPFNTPLEKVRALEPKGLILGGGPTRRTLQGLQVDFHRGQRLANFVVQLPGQAPTLRLLGRQQLLAQMLGALTARVRAARSPRSTRRSGGSSARCRGSPPRRTPSSTRLPGRHRKAVVGFQCLR